MSRRTGAPRIGLILLTLGGIVLASAGLATAVTMSVSAPVSARAGLSAVTGGGSAGAAADMGARATEPTPTPSEAWKPLPVDPAVADRSITDLTDGSSSRVTVDVLGVDVSPGQAGSLVAAILAVPLVIAVGVLVAAPRPRRWWRTAVLRRHG